MSEYIQDDGWECCCYDYRVDARLKNCVVHCDLRVIGCVMSDACKCRMHRLIKTQIGHARDFAWYRGQRPSPAHVSVRDSVTRACTDSRARKPLQLRDKSATLSRAWVVIVRHLDYILITRAGDGRWPRYQVKSLACPGCGRMVLPTRWQPQEKGWGPLYKSIAD